MNQKIKVLYLMGWGRSGTTILANILGQIEGFFSVGEIRSIWGCGFTNNLTCGCGKPFLTCDFWNRVIGKMSARVGTIQADRWDRICSEETRTRRAMKFLLPHSIQPSSPALREYLSVTGKLYETIQEVSGCAIIVDSSKFPFYGDLLERIPQLDLFTLHMIRDPRAVAYSWSVPRPQPDGPMRKIGSVESAFLWNIWNVSAEWFRLRASGRYLRIRYEDFIRRPRAAVEAILDLVHRRPASLPFISDSSVMLKPTHTIKGNPCRFQTGRVDLEEDLRWKTEMKRWKRWETEILTWPLSLRYGYPLFPSGSSGEDRDHPSVEYRSPS